MNHLIVFILILTLSGCAMIDPLLQARVERAVLEPPNGGRTMVDLDYYRFDRTLLDEAYTVSVGPPKATLAYWVTRPTEVRFQRLRKALPSGMTPCERASDKSRVAVLLHGWSRNSVRHGTDMRNVYAALLCRGYTILSPDLRGFGASTGDVASNGIYDKQDVKQMMDDAQRRGFGRGDYVLLGHSYGAAVAIQTAAHDPRVRGVVAMSAPRDVLSLGQPVRAIAREEQPVLYALFGSRLSDDIIGAAIADAAKRHGLDPTQASAASAARNLRVPVLIAHGEKDAVVPFAHAEAIRAAAPAKATLWRSKTDDHWSYRDREVFLQALGQWLVNLR
ncbi:alpha/beta hydrolase [Rhizobium sp. CFBP 8762]|uniref:alpha/beta hydrolase n=1 Tax=Rhizobium sp. CFBP 8762 TaxID=2775279 RepID=UPI00177C73A6|nr:alpha/beta hydrolase [Rhizobium sp. CFBP 8762]MBD8556398.1 alpha/beta hydrolase [Rhizobium sp. CFBP 8762]